MLDTTTQIRRLRRIVEAIIKLDLHSQELGENHLRLELKTLCARANQALKETRRGRGNTVNLDSAQEKGRAVQQRARNISDRHIRPILKQPRAEGFNTLQALAAELLKRGVKPLRAKTWPLNTIRNIERRHKDQ
jgi:hypothetical protein